VGLALGRTSGTTLAALVFCEEDRRLTSKDDKMAFPPNVVQTLAARSGQICNNPDCRAMTVGPVEDDPTLKTKIGEGAHLAGEKPGSARYDATMSDAERAEITNGIFLCSGCHTLIDKNGGQGYSIGVLREWKRKHEELMLSLLRGHRSPLPILRKFIEEQELAQDAMDTLEEHGALFVDLNLEDPNHVARSVERLRTEMRELRPKIRYDNELKEIIKDIIEQCQEYMNETSKPNPEWESALKLLRLRIGHQAVRRLRDDFGCTIRGRLVRILP
jgi:hypothetical protein